MAWIQNGSGYRSTKPKQWIYRVQERKLVWSWAKILDFSVKRFKIRTWNIAISLFGHALEMWFSFSFPVVFFPSSSLLSFLPLYTMAFCLFYHPRVDLAFNVLFRHPPYPLLNLPFLAGKLFLHCSGITSTLMRPEG